MKGIQVVRSDHFNGDYKDGLHAIDILLVQRPCNATILLTCC